MMLRAARLDRRFASVCSQDALWAPHFWRLVEPSGLPQDHCYLLKDFRTLCVGWHRCHWPTLRPALRLTQLMRCFARYLKWKDFSPERRAAGALVLFLVLRLRLPPHDRLCLRMNIHVYLGMCPGAACVCMEQGHMEQGHASPFVHSRDFRLRPAQAARQPPALQHKALALSRHPSAWTSLDDMCGCVQSHGQPFCLPTA